MASTTSSNSGDGEMNTRFPKLYKYAQNNPDSEVATSLRRLTNEYNAEMTKAGYRVDDKMFADSDFITGLYSLALSQGNLDVEVIATRPPRRGESCDRVEVHRHGDLWLHVEIRGGRTTHSDGYRSEADAMSAFNLIKL